ncbi:MAG: hypothetical protein KF890_00520 [Nitrospira sp.]|nr:hypothetical protein [Nitrospira sp.]
MIKWRRKLSTNKWLATLCVVFFVIYLGPEGEIQGEVMPEPLENLAHHADLIVVGKVIQKGEKTEEVWIQPTFHKKYHFFTATIQVDAVIKGDMAIKQVKVYYLMIGDTFGSLVLQRPSLFFIHYERDQPQPWNKPTVMSTTGDVPIDKNFALTDRTPKQLLSEFINKIQTILSIHQDKSDEGEPK